MADCGDRNIVASSPTSGFRFLDQLGECDSQILGFYNRFHFRLQDISPQPVTRKQKCIRVSRISIARFDFWTPLTPQCSIELVLAGVILHLRFGDSALQPHDFDDGVIGGAFLQATAIKAIEAAVPNVGPCGDRLSNVE